MRGSNDPSVADQGSPAFLTLKRVRCPERRLPRDLVDPRLFAADDFGGAAFGLAALLVQDAADWGRNG